MSTSDLDRSVLPIPDRAQQDEVPLDAKEATFRRSSRFASGGRAQCPHRALGRRRVWRVECVRGPCRTPTAERLAAGGLAYNRFHTTALCAPTRSACLLTGRNHHTVGMGAITEVATSAPGYTSIRPNTCAPLPETLRPTATRRRSSASAMRCSCGRRPMGPFDAWPTGGGGFEHFYGFIGGETNQYYPAIYEGTTPWSSPRRHRRRATTTADMTDRAIAWVRQQKALMPDKPFFVYFAPGAAHAPHHVPKEWSDRYKARFDEGWDVSGRRSSLARSELGIVPPDTELTPRHAEIPAWEDMPEQMKPVLARQMEVYAGFLEHTDHHVGRLVDALEDLGVLEDTLVYYIIGDNGASAEGTINGSFNETFLNGATAPETPDYLAARVDELGTPTAYNHYAAGWAHAMDTPYQWTKQVASHWGGTRNGTIVHWSNGFRERGEIRSQFHHVIDVAPTVLEAAGLPEPSEVNGATGADRGREHALTPSTRPTRPTGGRRSTSRCSATAASTTKVGPRSPATPHPGSWSRSPHSPMTSGSSTTRTQTGARRTTWRPSCPRSWPSYSSSGSQRRGSTTCSRSTTAASSASTPILPGGRSWRRATPSCSSAGWDA